MGWEFFIQVMPWKEDDLGKQRRGQRTFQAEGIGGPLEER